MNKAVTDRFWVGLLGLFTLGSLIFLSLIFWKERLVYTDMAFHTFVILQTKALAIQNNRFGAAFTQMFPLVSAKLQLPLHTLMKIYSVSFYIWYSLLFIVTLSVLRIKEMALVIVLYLTLLVSYSFFWAQSEYPQGMGFLALFFAVLLRFVSPKKSSLVGYALVTALLLVTLFFHPLIAFPFGCCMIYLFLENKILFKHLAGFAAIAIIILALKTVFLPTGYESEKMSGLKNFLTLFPNYITIPSTKFFIKQLFSDYLGYFLIVLSVCAVFIKNRQFLKLGWFIGSLTFYTFLINVSYPNIQRSAYMQNMLSPLGFLAAMPFVFEVLPNFKPKIWVTVMVVLVCFRLVMIYQSHKLYSDRVAFLQHMLNQSRAYPGSKFYVADEAITASGVVGDSWALSYETLLLSSLPSPDSARTIELESIYNERTFFHDSTSSFINRFWDHNANSLPKEYFRLKEGKYVKIEF